MQLIFIYIKSRFCAENFYSFTNNNMFITLNYLYMCLVLEARWAVVLNSSYSEPCIKAYFN